MSKDIESGEIKRMKMSDEVYSNDRQMSKVKVLKSQLLDLLECPVCLEIPRRGPIYGCKNGHVLCRTCKSKVFQCPTCRDRKLSSRNLVAEKMLEKAIEDYPLKCKFRAHYGCAMEGLLPNVEIHEVFDCNFRTVQCPARDTCGWKGPLTQLIQHVIQGKCVAILSPRSSNSLFVWLISILTGEKTPVFSIGRDLSWRPILLKTQDPLNNFCILNTTRDSLGYWKVYVNSISPVKNAMRVEICAQNPFEVRDKFTFTGDVASSEESEKDILQKGNYLMLRDDQVRKLIDQKMGVVFQLSIRIFQE